MLSELKSCPLFRYMCKGVYLLICWLFKV